MIKLIYERPEIHREYSGTKSITMELDDELDLDEMLDSFKHFLLANGYFINGNIQVVEDEQTSTS